MKIAITGHTSGVGKEFLKQCKTRGYSADGYSRSNGYDLENYDRIAESICEEDYDIFFNNAWHEFGQAKLLQSVHNRWKNERKLIITNGSYTSDFLYRFKAKKEQEPSQINYAGKFLHSGTSSEDYLLSKRNLEDMHKRCTVKGNTKCVLIKTGVIDTPMSKHKLDSCKLRAVDIAKYVMWIIDQPDEIHIPSITILPYTI